MNDLHPRLRALADRFAPTPLQRIADPAWSARGVALSIKRDDLLHPVISGNKWRKLKYPLNDALQRGADTLVSMGGVYSNHLHALAYAGRELGLKTAAFVRGERPAALNPTLLDLMEWNMALHFVSREDYRNLRAYREWNSLPGIRPGQYWLPEGGASEWAWQGVAEAVAEIDAPYDILALACGTGTTLAGAVGAVASGVEIVGVPALKGGEFLYRDIPELLAAQGRSDSGGWRLWPDYHFGGFARTTPALLEFIAVFEARHGIELEPVYTGKLLYAVYDRLQAGDFQAGQHVVVWHSGGLQGKREIR